MKIKNLIFIVLLGIILMGCSNKDTMTGIRIDEPETEYRLEEK